MYDNDRVPGYHLPVDDSGPVLGGRGFGPVPQDAITQIPSKTSEAGGVRVKSLSPLAKDGAGPSPQDPTLNFFADPFILNDTANLDENFRFPLYEPSECSPKYIVLQCGCGRRIVPSTCMSLDCKICKKFVGHRRMTSILKRVLGSAFYQAKSWTRVPVIYTVFTVPENQRARFVDKKAWQKVRRKAWAILKKSFGAKFGVEATHPVGDKSSSRFHPHLNYLWIQRDGFSPYLDQKELYQQWSNVLSVDKVDVWTNYSTSIPQIVKWAKYVSRTFPGAHTWIGSMRWYGRYPTIKKPNQYRCEKCGVRFKVVGTIYAWLVDEWRKSGAFRGVDPPWLDDTNLVSLPSARKVHER